MRVALVVIKIQINIMYIDYYLTCSMTGVKFSGTLHLSFGKY